MFYDKLKEITIQGYPYHLNQDDIEIQIYTLTFDWYILSLQILNQPKLDDSLMNEELFHFINYEKYNTEDYSQKTHVKDTIVIIKILNMNN